jgi:hypothetical protein
MTEHQPPSEPIPPWIVAVPGRPVEPRGNGRRGLVLVLAGLAAVLVLAVGVFLAVRHFVGGVEPDVPVTEPTTAATLAPPVAEATTVPTEQPTETRPANTADPDAEALAQLDDLSRQDLARVSLNRQLVAQLASKTPGIVDPRQLAADGTHTFRATDILREHQNLRDDPRNGTTTVVLLKTGDFGKRQLYEGKPLYVTFALREFTGEGAVRAWCAQRFAELSGQDLANQCAVRRLNPPSPH